MKPNQISRRKFLTQSAVSAIGCTIAVTAPQTLCAATLAAASASGGAPAPTPASGGKSAKLPPLVKGGAHASYKALADEPLMRQLDLKCDVLVAGGGLSGIATALAAARRGKKVILVQDRSRLGGNASSEIKMHPLGVDPRKTGWREGGIIEELKLENACKNPGLSWEVWDFILYDKVVSEPNIQLLLDTSVYRVETRGDKITHAWTRSDTTLNACRIEAALFVDATGDCRLGREAGAPVFSGRETKETFGESLSGYDPEGTRQGSTLMITSRAYDKPMPFQPPTWAKKITAEHLKLRRISDKSLEYGYWWIELGGVYDAIRDNEQLRFELLSIVMGIWDYVKNSGKFPNAANRVLETIGMVPGRRDTYRLVGDHVMTQLDIEGGWKQFDDAIAVGGWPMDDHPAEGFWASDRRGCRQIHGKQPYYNIPFGCLYSKKITNLMMAGRNISASHVAFSSTRVMSTCAAIGQAVGTAAAMCLDANILPARLRADKTMVKRLQQELLRDNQTILDIKNEDPRDLAPKAKVTASESALESKPENVVSGTLLDSPKTNNNRWLATADAKPWLKLEWDAPVRISQVRLAFDGGKRRLTQTGQQSVIKTMVVGVQPELVRDYTITAILPDGSERALAEVSNNYQNLRVHTFDSVTAKAVRIDIAATNGAGHAIIKEVRVES
ncbi:hypothetical protein M2447_002514 [Ereboglobus sp. PH5-10]|uniref:FAD-dependent oxidoreductase n=1 Tax=Ereboglobus sp. PH5-10 TaxID=2940629 RepID=UPI002404ABAB|nr:FAD-dependent oxidoreductase [Ereboglobus sp. PH5-10]MDF9828395.1 hypothetical protein [Ereboglobus sp. PH5-10]